MPKQFVVQWGAKFEREPKTPHHAMIFWESAFSHTPRRRITPRNLPVQCQQYKL